MNLTLEQWALLLSAIAAWVALGISLWNLWQGRPSRRVEVRFVDPARGIEMSRLRPGVTHVSVTFINERGPTVVVHEVGFEFPDGRKIPCEAPLPARVSSGDAAKFPVGLAGLRGWVQEEGAIFVKAYCRDATGHRYKTPLSQEIRSALSG